MSSPRWNHVLEHLAQQTAPSDWTDAQLLEVFCTRRDEAAFEAIVTRHGAMVRSVCQRALSNPSDVEDVVQATFFTLAQKASSIRNRASLGNWLHGVAHRLALKVVRGLRVSHTLTEAEDQGTSDPLDAMTARELCTALDEELQRLPTDGQSAIVLCCLEGLTRDEAAQQMGWTLSKLKFWLQKGRELLRSRLQNRGVSLPAFLGTTLVPLAIAEVPSEMKRSIAKLSTQMLQTPLSQMQLSPRIKTLVEGALKSMTHQPFRALLASLTLILMLGMGVMLLAQDKKKPKLLKDPSKIVKKKKPGPVTHVKLLGQLHHEKAVHEIAISPDGRSIITGAFGCKSQIWDVATMKPRNTPQSHYGDVCSVAFSGDGRFALTSDWRDAQVWDVATGKKRGKALPHWMREDTVVGPAISPDGTRVATRATKTTSQLWDVATGKPIGKPIQQGGTVVELRFSADSRALFIRGGKGPFLQNARTGEQMVRKFKHKGYVSDVAFSRDGRLIATASPDKTVKVWDVRTGKLVGKPLVHDEGVRRVGKDKDNALLTSGQTTASFWYDVTKAKPRRWVIRYVRWLGSVAFFPDGELALTNCFRGVHVWKIGEKKALWEQKQGPFNVGAIPGSGGTILLTSPRAETARLMDLKTGRELLEATHFRSATFGPGRLLLIGGKGGVRIWKLLSGKKKE